MCHFRSNCIYLTFFRNRPIHVIFHIKQEGMNIICKQNQEITKYTKTLVFGSYKSFGISVEKT